ncbi:MAG: RluA family pseudouridine synthase [Myxococcota bacterium]|nr:RluA family pseudouridine synthase [Myxococcota bacterium]
MFGVLVVADRDGRIATLRGFSGMLGGHWHVDGFVPPLFDVAARDAVWPAGEAELRTLARRIEALAGGETARCREQLAAIDDSHANVLAELRDRHRVDRAARRAARHAAHASSGNAVHHALDQASRADAAEKKRLLAAHADARDALARRLAVLDDERRTVEQLRADRSRHYLGVLFDTYVIANARGEQRRLRTLFDPEMPPGGAGDCAAPKLLGEAYRRGLRPLALAEVWWGAPPATGGRHAGVFYPACHGKCGPILAHMLEGLDADMPPVFGLARLADNEPRVIFEDEWLVVVDKPAGLLSVPGRSGLLRDSVQVRLRARYPAATGPLVVHRLDLETSGVLVAAKDDATHAALQRLFARREVTKRYIAWLDGIPAAERGVVDLALRVDLDDRPRQLHDPVHGKPAVTRWEVIARDHGRTRVALFPQTGRTHQLRVHAAHACGIGVPIVGDRLYGREADRLQLHAEALAFLHPRTGAPLLVERMAPF